jgi:hypothetical protein
MLDNLCIHRKFIAILLLPLVLLAAWPPAVSAPTSRRACRQAG